MEDFQSKVRTVIYSVFAVIIGIVLIRVLLKLVGANPNNEFTQFWYDFSSVFVEPWATIYPSIISGRMVIETYSIVGVFFYLIISIVTSRSIGSPFENTAKLALVGIVDSIFKIVEFLLITRFIFRLTAASTSAVFVRLIYDLSWVVYEPFATLAPGIEFDGARFEISTLIALVIIIILDLVTEQLLFSLLDAMFPERPKTVKKIVHTVQPAQPVYVNPLPPAQPMAQPTNINIHIPQQQPPQTYVDRRQVNVRSVQPRPVVRQTIKSKPQKRGFLSWPKRRSSRAGGPGNS